MAKNITIAGQNYSNVPAVEIPITGGGTARFVDTYSVSYSLTGGVYATPNVSLAIAGEGLMIKLAAPSGYDLSGVSVTMGNTDITSTTVTYT